MAYFFEDGTPVNSGSGYQFVDEKSSAARRVVGDTGISLLKGAIGVPEAVVGLGDILTGGYAGKIAESIGFRPKEAKGALDDLLSPEQKAANQRLQEAKGFWNSAGTALSNPSTIFHAGVESLPGMLGGGAVARELVKRGAMSPIVAAGVGEGLFGAGQSAEEIRQNTQTGLLAPHHSAAAATSGALTGLLGTGGGTLARKLGIADVDTWIAGQSAPLKLGKDGKGFFRRVAEAGISEGVFEELPQSAQEQLLKNYALDKPLTEGVPEAAALGMLTGGMMGGMAGGIRPPSPRETLLSTASDIASGRSTKPATPPKSTVAPLPQAEISVAPAPQGSALEATANRLGVSPSDLAAVIHYETAGTMSPKIMGGTGGRYMGLIQFGPEEQRRYGANANQTFDEQLQAVERYLVDRGLPKGADIATIYRTVNGGNPNAGLHLSDGNGTIAQHIERIKRDHLPKAQEFLAKQGVASANPVEKETLEALIGRTRDITPEEMVELMDLGYAKEGGQVLPAARRRLKELNEAPPPPTLEQDMAASDPVKTVEQPAAQENAATETPLKLAVESAPTAPTTVEAKPEPIAQPAPITQESGVSTPAPISAEPAPQPAPAAQAATTGTAVDVPRETSIRGQTSIRPHVETLIARRAAAKELGIERAFNAALAKAKQAMAGEKIEPKVFDNYAKLFKQDEAMAGAMRGISAGLATPATVDVAANEAATSKKNDLPQPTEAENSGGTVGAPVDVVRVPDVYGRFHYVSKRDLEGNKNQLMLYGSSGKRLVEAGSIHRDNIDIDGAKRENINRDLPYIASEKDTPFKTVQALKQAMNRLKQSENDWDVRKVSGGFIAAPKNASNPEARTESRVTESQAPDTAKAMETGDAGVAPSRETGTPESKARDEIAAAKQKAKERREAKAREEAGKTPVEFTEINARTGKPEAKPMPAMAAVKKVDEKIDLAKGLLKCLQA